MTMWGAVLIGCAACFVLKAAGYVVPARWLEGRVVSRVTTLLPVALLAALVAVQSFTTDGRLVLDARLAAVVVAVVLLSLRANFVVVVLAAAVVAAALRAVGWVA
ncbi:conserved membrane hypothetical protein [Nostocoides japonicum T1-X7]|uniref:Branched-chain amino acid transport n=1 Tax=Nostocoides japonicum T1-X7 TaxID=1194083 RepID=A0A077LTD6_9MICO|nr:AzlD domain-containing protein [Tetrasphaera japonica]CCH76436.1 conserved membrane hypothetical protein [Tetrasphaera japonica T1-X7]